MIKVKINEQLEKINKKPYWLSREAKITASSLTKLIKNETTGINFDVLEKICDVLNCDISDILEITK